METTENNIQTNAAEAPVIPELSAIRKVMEEMGKVLIGKPEVIECLIVALISGGHVLIEDVPGTGKTTIAAALGKATGLDCRRVQFTPDVMASDITGFTMFNKETNQFEYKPGLAMCNILLADEINRTSPKTQSSLLEVMEEGKVTVDGNTYEVPTPFMVIATQNPLGFVGTHPLPEAQIDRFLLKISVGYPEVHEEISIIADRRNDDPMDHVAQVISGEEIIKIVSMVKDIYIDPTLYKYIVELVTATRSHSGVLLGASPRASLSLMHVAQAVAFLNGRDYVIPTDITKQFHHAISHRITLNQEAKINKLTVNEILTEILETVPAPIKE